MFAPTNCRRALTLLLAGTALALPFSGAQSQVLRDARGLGAPAPTLATASWLGTWAIQFGNHDDHKAYLEIKLVDGQPSGRLYQRLDDEWRAGSTLLIDTASSSADRIVGTLVESGAVAKRLPVEISTSSDRSFVTMILTSDTGAKSVLFGLTTPGVGTAFTLRTQAQTTAAMLGTWVSPHGELSISQGSEPTMLAGTFRRPGTPTDNLRIEGLVQPQGVAQRWYLGRYDSGASGFRIQLSPDGRTVYAFGGRPADSVAETTFWQATRAAAPQPAPAPAPTPAPVPAPAPVPTEPPPPVAEAPSLPGTVQAGAFHQLGVFDVRFDEARPHRDGRVQASFTVRNASGREQSFGAGALVAVMTDADGVGVRESQAYRASADEHFSPSPVIPAGGELKVRYLLQPPIVHGSLRRLSVREYGEKKVLSFALPASSDPGASPAPAPPAGGGSFKSLSEFDVRIDRVAPARDGKLEVFVTLRNPSNLLRSTSKGHIKISGTDSDGAKATSVSALFSVRGQRGQYDELPTLVYVEPASEARLRFIFDQAISGPITISDGTVSQTFTAG